MLGCSGPIGCRTEGRICGPHVKAGVDNGCIRIQGPHPYPAAFEDHSGVTMLYHFEGSFKRGLEMRPPFTESQGIHLMDPSQTNIQYAKIHCGEVKWPCPT